MGLAVDGGEVFGCVDEVIEGGVPLVEQPVIPAKQIWLGLEHSSVLPLGQASHIRFAFKEEVPH